MSKDSLAGKLLRAGLLTAGAVGVYIYTLRPWLMGLGTSDDERSCRLPGDDLVQNPKWSFTHAVTIHTEADEIWPWLVQWGYGRAGFYSFDWLDSLLLGQGTLKSADHILPELQELKTGDSLPVEPNGGGFVVERMETNRYILLANRLDLLTMQRLQPGAPLPPDYVNVSWLWYLDPKGGCRTRMISRARVDIQTSKNQAMSIWVGEPLKPGSAIMDWGMLQGIKRRAEEAGCVPNDQ
ncbi:MAG TPA: hypothetical protein VF498_17920 [Anaerolineales bacterium]